MPVTARPSRGFSRGIFWLGTVRTFIAAGRLFLS
jgi:hypothetical protein